LRDASSLFPEGREGHWNKVRISDTDSVESQLDLMLNFERYSRFSRSSCSMSCAEMLHTGVIARILCLQAGVDQQSR